MKPPNWVDLVLIILLFKGCYSGFGRGFITETLRLVGLVLATVVAINSHAIVSQWFFPMFWFGPKIGAFLTFLIILFVMLFVVSFTVRIVGRVLKWERHHWAVQGMGLLIGGVRGLWIGGLFAVILTSSGFDYLRDSVERESVFGGHLHERARMVFTRVSARAPGGETRDPRLVPRVR